MARYVAGRRPGARPSFSQPLPPEPQFEVPMVYQGAVGSSVTLNNETLTIEAWGWLASKARKKASPRVIPLGAIAGFDAQVVQSGMRYVQLAVRGHQVLDPPGMDLNSFPVHDDGGRDRFLRALEVMIQRAKPVEDFEAHLRRELKPAKYARPLKEPTFLDWMQG